MTRHLNERPSRFREINDERIGAKLRVETAQRHVAVQSLARKTDGLIAFSWHDLVSKTHRGPSFARMAGHDKGTIRPLSRGSFLLLSSWKLISIFDVPLLSTEHILDIQYMLMQLIT